MSWPIGQHNYTQFNHKSFLFWLLNIWMHIKCVYILLSNIPFQSADDQINDFLLSIFALKLDTRHLSWRWIPFRSSSSPNNFALFLLFFVWIIDEPNISVKWCNLENEGWTTSPISTLLCSVFSIAFFVRSMSRC